MRTKVFDYGLVILALFWLTACDTEITVGGSVSGLTGSGLILQNNGGDDLIVNVNGNFVFETPLASPGGAYDVTVKAQPTAQVCTVSNGSGTASVKISDIKVQCVANGLAALQLLAGSLGGPGNIDGPGTAARFSGPFGIAVDNAGNAYVADTNNGIIRKITHAGVVTTFAGSVGHFGSADGTGAAASFGQPKGIAVDGASNLYVADATNGTVRKISPAGVVTTLAGTAGSTGNADGIGAAAKFAQPTGIAVDGAGNVYVTDILNQNIRKITPVGVVTTLAGGHWGSNNGTGTEAGFIQPSGIAVDSAGYAYVTDTYNQTIRKISPGGVVTTLAGAVGANGGADGIGATARFYGPTGIAVDSSGYVFVTESANNTIRKISPAGVVTTIAGTAGAYGAANDGSGASARFDQPMGVALDSTGNVYVADTNNSIIRKITPARVVTTLAGTAIGYGDADGTGAAAKFFQPSGIAIDSAGNAYVADTWTGIIRKITPAGKVTTLAGTAYSTGYADGKGAAASFFQPTGVAVDGAGNVYVADTGNSAIRKITPVGVVTTLAGAYIMTGSDGESFSGPTGIAVDSGGNLYVANAGNATVRKVSPAGEVAALAGSGRKFGSADGTGTAAMFQGPSGIAVDSMGNVYVADAGNLGTFFAPNNTIRKITPAGVVTTLAGTAGVVGSADGTGAAASFNNPQGMAVDSVGNLYVADSGNRTIRKITPEGVVSTVVGSAGRVGVQLGALPAALGNGGAMLGVVGVAVSADRLFVSSENSLLWAPRP